MTKPLDNWNFNLSRSYRYLSLPYTYVSEMVVIVSSTEYRFNMFSQKSNIRPLRTVVLNYQKAIIGPFIRISINLKVIAEKRKVGVNLCSRNVIIEIDRLETRFAVKK